MDWQSAPVGRLATADGQGRPHCVPVCFAFWQERIWIALDEKPKRVQVTRLRRVRNVLENPRVVLLVDHYEADWSKLWFVMVEGLASLEELTAGALRSLREKYPQYQSMQLMFALAIEPARIVRWHSSEGFV